MTSPFTLYYFFVSKIYSIPFIKISAIVLVCIAFIANISEALKLGLKNAPAGWQIDAIPVYLSSKYFGQPDDYTELIALANKFQRIAEVRDEKSVDQAINESKKFPLKTVVGSGIRVLNNDDKGVVDYVRIAFLLFGERSSSLLWFYFALLGLSSGLLCWVFFKTIWPNILLCGLLIAHYAVMPAVASNPQLTNLYSMRFIASIALVPLLYILLIFLFTKTLPWTLFPVAVIQVLLLAFFLHVRITILSHIAILALIGFCTIGVRFWRMHKNVLLAIKVCLSYSVLWFLIVATPIAHTVFLKARLSKLYFVPPNIPVHVTWHNVLSGLSLSPSLQAEYGFKVDDVSTIAATGKWLQQQGEETEWKAMGGESPGFAKICWTPYDRACGKMFFYLVYHEPIQIVCATVFWKPLVCFREFTWLMCPTAPYPERALLHPSHLAQMPQMVQKLKSHPFQPFSLEILIFLSAIAILVAPTLMVSKWKILSVAGILLLMGAAPVLIGYPLVHAMGETMVTMLVVIYMVLCIGITFGISKIAKRWIVAR